MNDTALMERIAEQDEVAFRSLVQLYFDRLFRYAARLLGDRIEAEDAIQDCFLTVWRKAETWKPTASLSSWLHRIVHNHCIDLIRKRRAMEDSNEIDLIDPAPSPESRAISAETDQLVDAAIRKLPLRQQAALHLVHFGGLSGAEAAATLEISVEALESLLSRARRTLREAMARDMAKGAA